MMQYLGIIEQKTNELLAQYASLQAKANGSDGNGVGGNSGASPSPNALTMDPLMISAPSTLGGGTGDDGDGSDGNDGDDNGDDGHGGDDMHDDGHGHAHDGHHSAHGGGGHDTHDDHHDLGANDDTNDQ
jgi:hypothetical protein